MSDPVKYTFDQAFDGGAKNRFDLEVANLRQEIEVTRKESYAAGLEEGRNQMRSEIEAATHSVAQDLVGKASALFDQHAEVEARITADMGLLAYTIGERLAAGLREKLDLAGIDRLVEECLDALHNQADIRVHASADIAERLQQVLHTAASERGHEGRIEVVGVADMAPADCRISWGDGGLERAQEKIDQAVRDKVSEFLKMSFAQDTDYQSKDKGA